MGTKRNPGLFCGYSAALPDEPYFTLLARDATAPVVVRTWAKYREFSIKRGTHPKTDLPMLENALGVAGQMEAWRAANEGAWRRPAPPRHATPEIRASLAAWVANNPTDAHARLVGLLLADIEGGAG